MQRAGGQQRLILGLPQIEAPLIDILLHHRVDQVGDIPVHVDILPDAGGADILQLGGQLQLHHLAEDHAHIGVHVLLLPVEGGDTAEHDMVHAVDGIGAGRRLVGGRAVDHVGAHDEVQLTSGEHVLQPPQIAGIGDVDGDIVGEQMHMEFVRHRHGGDPAADQAGLGLFRPGELVHRQKHLVPHVPDGAGQRLVGQGKGVEGAGEEGHPLPLAEGEGAVVCLVPDDELVHAVQRRRAVQVVQPAALILVQQKQQLVGAQGEQPRPPLIGEPGRGEQRVAQHVQRLLLYRLAVGGHALQQQSCQTAATAIPYRFLLRETLGVGAIGLQREAHRVQRRGRHAVGGMAQKLRQIVDDLVQLCRRKPQHERAQILGDILGKFVVAGFQRLGQLHGDLVALVAGEPGRNAQQSAARPLTHHHRLADTDQVGEVGGDLHGAAQTAGGVPGQQLHIHHLDHPRGGGFQVVQQDIRDLLAAEGQHRLLRRNAAHTGIPVAQRRQRQHELQLSLLPQPLQRGVERMTLRQRLAGPEEELQRRRLQRRRFAVALGQREGGHPLRLLLRQQLQRQIAQRVRQGQRRAVVLHVGRLVVGQQHRQELGRLLGRAVFQRGGYHQLGGEPDVAGLLGRQLVVGIKQQVQVLGPQGELSLLHLRPACRRGQLLLVAQAELGHHPAHQRRRLTANVTLRVQQQLIEEVHRLDLLVGGQIREVVLQHAQIGAHPRPVLFAAGHFQQVGEQPLVAETAHHVQVVLHRHQAEGPVVLLGPHQGDIHGLLRVGVPAPQRHVHAVGDQIFLKVPQLPVNVLIPPLFGGVHVVQLAEDHVKGVLQGVQRRRLPAVLLPPLLGAEVGVDQQHGLHRQVGQLQIPRGVVARHLSHLRKPRTGQPLVGIVVVEIGHPLTGHAAEFADIVACRRRGGQRQIHRRTAAPQGPARRHGHVVHHGDVLQGAEGR